MKNEENTSDDIYNIISKEYMSKSLKAKLATIQHLKDQVSNEEDTIMEKELLELTSIYNSQFKTIEEEMSNIIKGSHNFTLPESLIEKNKLPQYDKEKIKEIPLYWLTVIKNSKYFYLTQEDEEVLMKLKDIVIKVHEDNLSFTLLFYFDDNDAFENTILEKTYYLDKKTKDCYKTGASDIKWKKNTEDTYKKFFFDIFTIFESYDNIKSRHRIEADNTEGDRFKNDIIPFSLEFYLNIMSKSD